MVVTSCDELNRTELNLNPISINRTKSKELNLINNRTKEEKNKGERRKKSVWNIVRFIYKLVSYGVCFVHTFLVSKYVCMYICTSLVR